MRGVNVISVLLPLPIRRRCSGVELVVRRGLLPWTHETFKKSGRENKGNIPYIDTITKKMSEWRELPGGIAVSDGEKYACDIEYAAVIVRTGSDLSSFFFPNFLIFIFLAEALPAAPRGSVFGLSAERHCNNSNSN